MQVESWQKAESVTEQNGQGFYSVYLICRNIRTWNLLQRIIGTSDMRMRKGNIFTMFFLRYWRGYTACQG